MNTPVRLYPDVVYESLRIPQPTDDDAHVFETPAAASGQGQQAEAAAAAAFVKKKGESVLAADEGEETDTADTGEKAPARRVSIIDREALTDTLTEIFRAAYVGDTEEEATAAANAKEDCRSDDPEHCRVHGTPLKKPSSYPKQWKPLTVRMETTAEQARAKLRTGISAKDPLGNDLTLDESIVRHWEEEGKTPQDINHRLSYLPVIEQSIRTPAEIWEDEGGTRIYMAAFHTKHGSRVYPLSFTVNKDQSRIRTYFPNERYINTKRKGKLLYEAKVTSDAQSP